MEKVLALEISDENAGLYMLISDLYAMGGRWDNVLKIRRLVEECDVWKNTRPLSTRWSPPAPGMLKINSDGAFLQDRGTGAAGAVVRDSSGNFCAASARWLGPVGSVLIAEAEAIRDGLRLIPQGTMEHIIGETDAQEVVTLWKNRTRQRSEIAAILKEIEEIVSAFTSFELIHVRREANFVAHTCARFASSSLDSHVWFSPPSFLQRCLQSDTPIVMISPK
jgi:ribonuclease HI